MVGLGFSQRSATVVILTLCWQILCLRRRQCSNPSAGLATILTTRYDSTSRTKAACSNPSAELATILTRTGVSWNSRILHASSPAPPMAPCRALRGCQPHVCGADYHAAGSLHDRGPHQQVSFRHAAVAGDQRALLHGGRRGAQPSPGRRAVPSSTPPGPPG